MKNKLFRRATSLILSLLICLDAGLVGHVAADENQVQEYTREYTNIALNKTVTATNTYEDGTYYSTAYLTDGVLADINVSSHLGWSTNPNPGASESDVVDLVLNLDGRYAINEVSICPMVWESGKFFPRSYEVLITQDGENWAKVGEAVDLDQAVVGSTPQKYSFADTIATKVKIHITKSRVTPVDGAIFSQIGEIQVNGYYVGAADVNLQNVALHKSVSATNTYEDGTYYSTAYLTDGALPSDLSVNTHIGFSTNPNSPVTVDEEVDILTDLGATYMISQVDVCPIAWENGKFFPASFDVLVSKDGSTWTKVGTAEDLDTAKVKTTPQTFVFADTLASQVKIHITKNRLTPVDGNIFSQIGEIQVNGYSVYSGKTTINKSALRMNPGSTDQLQITIDAPNTVPNVTWSSDNENIAKIDANGKVTAVSDGTTVLRGHEAITNTDLSCNIVVDDYVATQHFMISAFWPMLKSNMNDEYMDLMANAGITNVQLNYVLDVANYEDNMKIAQMAYERGMGVTVSDKKWGWGKWANYSNDEIYADAMKYSHVPGVIGYYLIDEPSDVTPFLHVFDPIKAAMPTADVHFNFTGAMSGMEKLAQNVGNKLDYLMYDAYIYPNEGIQESNLFSTSDKCRKLGLKYNIKTGKYIQSCGFNGAYRKPNGNEIRYDVNTALAYGFKQINYFCWRMPVGVGAETYTSAIVTEDGKPTEIYDDVRAVNKTVLALGDTLMKLDAIDVYHTGKDSGANNALPQDFFVKPTETKDLILSYMRDKSDGTNYAMLVNRDYASSSTVSFTLDSKITSAQRIDNITGEAVAMTPENGVYTYTFEPGGCLLIKIDNAYDYTPNYGKFVETPAGKNAALSELTKIADSTGNNALKIMDGSRLLDGWTAELTNDVQEAKVTVSFGGQQTLNRVDLYPGNPSAFPKNFVIELSNDGNTWNTVVEKTDYVVQEGTVPSFTFDKVKAKFIRLRVTGANNGKVQINEWELYNDDGTMPAPTGPDTSHQVVQISPSDNLARGKKIIYSSSYEYSPYWSSSHINDGIGYDAIPSGNAGWSGVNRFNTATNEEWVGYNLGKKMALNKTIVFNAFAGPAECFPTDYAIDVSNDGVIWKTVYSVVNDANCAKVGARVIEFSPVAAQYIRFRGIRQSWNAEGFMMQLSELEVYGKELADTAALEALYDAQKNKVQEDYTDSSWIAFSTAMKNAKTVLENITSLQSEIDNAQSALKEAADGLVKKDPAVSVDKTSLQNAYDANCKRQNVNYTTESWNAFIKALQNAKTVLESGNSQSKIDSALADLEKAANALTVNSSSSNPSNTHESSNSNGVPHTGENIPLCIILIFLASLTGALFTLKRNQQPVHQDYRKG